MIFPPFKEILYRMKMENNTNTKLISFLHNIANSLEDNQLSKKQTLRVGEFFMAYQFQEAAHKDKEQNKKQKTKQNDDDEDDENDENDENDDDDNLKFDISELTKFIYLGWYVYCVILKGKTLEG